MRCPLVAAREEKIDCLRANKLTAFLKLIIIEKILGAEGLGEIES